MSHRNMNKEHYKTAPHGIETRYVTLKYYKKRYGTLRRKNTTYHTETSTRLLLNPTST